MAGTVSARFTERRAATRATAALRAAGFSPEDIELIPEGRANLGPPPAESAVRALIGGIIGAIIGGAVAAIIALVISLIVAPHTVGITVLWVALVGVGIGFVIGALAGSGRSLVGGEYRREAIRQGRTTLTVRADGREMEAKDILLRFGGTDVRDILPGERGEYHTPPDTTQGAPA